MQHMSYIIPQRDKRCLPVCTDQQLPQRGDAVRLDWVEMAYGLPEDLSYSGTPLTQIIFRRAAP